MSKIKLSENFIKNTVKLALNEDLYPSGDITSSLIKKKKIVNAKLLSNQNGLIGGLRFAKYAFTLIDGKTKFKIKKKDGTLIKKNSLILLDIGFKFNGYCCDITRTFPSNGKFNNIQKDILKRL